MSGRVARGGEDGVCRQPRRQRLSSMTPLLLEKHLLVTQATVAGSRRQTFEVPVDGEDAGAVEVLRPARVRAFVLGGVPAPV